ncbi:MAG: outer membrane lipoprotein carrier protein LolA [Gammaproteobacteria bacterium]|nr:outer membrane lipoprotein carrier protein LolA [Gammaproteobacteria bacterium]
MTTGISRSSNKLYAVSSRPWRVAGYILLIILLLISAHLAAREGSDYARLMQLLASQQQNEVRYTQQKHYHLLTIPLNSRGWLRYTAPDRMIWVKEGVREERYEITGQQLQVIRENQLFRTLDLAAAPQLRAFIEAFRATLSGDRELLESHYRVVFSGTLAEWCIELEPRSDEMRRFVSTIRFTGDSEKLQTIEIAEANGDWSKMQLEQRQSDEY